MTAGVVRIGNTVRRPRQPNSDLTHRLLDHFASIAFNGAPRFIGTDESGRDILSYIEGDVPNELGWYDDDALIAAARLIRRFHDASVGLVIPGAGEDSPEVICHNDLSPCNFVFHDNRPAAVIDFDMAAPGQRRMDLAYAAWCWLDLGNSEISVANQRRRLRLFTAAYGHSSCVSPIKDAILARQQLLAEQGDASGRHDMAQWARACRTWCVANLED